MAKETYTNKSGVEIHGVKPGADFVIDCDEEGTPKDFNWRRRLKDSAVDKCIEKKQVAELIEKSALKVTKKNVKEES